MHYFDIQYLMSYVGDDIPTCECDSIVYMVVPLICKSCVAACGKYFTEVDSGQFSLPENCVVGHHYDCIWVVGKKRRYNGGGWVAFFLFW